jgi:predicted RNA-binding Zn-ribbon protein involved in translation (DUF1610 family)
MSLKPYKCTKCGHEKEIDTNHYGECYSLGKYNSCESCHDGITTTTWQYSGDLFECPENLPDKIQNLLKDAGEVDTYEKCTRLKARLNFFGYDFEFGLDAQPFNLHTI